MKKVLAKKSIKTITFRLQLAICMQVSNKTATVMIHQIKEIPVLSLPMYL